MKKLFPLPVVMAVVLLAGSSFALAQSQDSAKEEKPTFYRLIPGVYVNGWPRFTIHYPKDWVEETPLPQEVFRAGTTDPTLGEKITVAIVPLTQPLDKLADSQVNFFKNVAKDVTLVSDKPTRLWDGTPAWEVELKMVLNGLPLNLLNIATKKGDMLINPTVGSLRGRVREDLKAILYSLHYEPGKDEPVKVPPDIQEFLEKWCSDFVSHDLAKVMTHYSNRYLRSGAKKGEVERSIRQFIGSITCLEVGITDLVPEGDKFYLAGFVSLNGTKYVLPDTSIIKENGEWKWYGNQRDVSP
jgi:hypothetical protein